NIRNAIAREIEIERKKAEAEERLAAANAAADNKPAPATKARSNAGYLNATPEAAKLSNAFESNRGSLPWPVAAGSITERFGNHMEGQASYTNDGVNIETAEGATVRAVFNGKVTTIRNQFGKYFVLIKHGEYFTVYQNLKSVSVAQGDEVTTKQTIGTVADNEGTPQLQFQVRRGMNAQNPEGWIAK
ncbi:MAG: peptidase M23, partial [Pedobacter sp.]